MCRPCIDIVFTIRATGTVLSSQGGGPIDPSIFKNEFTYIYIYMYIYMHTHLTKPNKFIFRI